MALQVLQDRAVSKFKATHSRFDPAIVFIIAEMVVQLIEMMEDCLDENEATKVCNEPTWLQKRLVHLRVHRMMGREYRHSGKDVVKALLETGKSVTHTEMMHAYAELS